MLATFPHHLDEDGGFAVVLVQPRSGVMIGLHRHEGHPADGFAWTAWLDDQGVSHRRVQEVQSPMPFATVVFRDPDNIQLELIHLPS